MDTLIKTLSASGHFRAFVLDATETLREAARTHDSMASSTVALGRTLMAALILAANEKGDSKITVKVLGDGDMGPIIAVADATGTVKGYVHNPDLDYRRTATGEVLVAPLVGAGSLVVIKDMGLGQPYSGQVDLITGEIGEDLAWYFLSSEQTPSSVGLTVLLDKADRVTVAGGFMVQALPDATEDEIADMEARIHAMPALSSLLSRDKGLSNLADTLYGSPDGYKVLAQQPLRFHCDCSRDRFTAGLRALGNKELTAMIEEDHGAEIVCQFCRKTYSFDEKTLNDLILESNHHE